MAENESVEETEMTDEQSLEAAGDMLATTTAPEETSEEPEDTDEGSVDEALGFTLEDKRALGRVQGLQSKTDSTASKVDGIESTLKTLVETFQNGLNPNKPLDSEELTQRLTGENGPEFLKQQAQEANADLREEMRIIKANQEALTAQQNAQKAQSDYQDELMELSGNEWGTLEPTYNKILEAISAGVEAGNEEALKKQGRIQNNPEYLHSLAMKVASGTTRAKAQAHEARLDSVAESAKDATSSGPVVPPPETMSEDEGNEMAMKILLGQ